MRGKLIRTLMAVTIASVTLSGCGNKRVAGESTSLEVIIQESESESEPESEVESETEIETEEKVQEPEEVSDSVEEEAPDLDIDRESVDESDTSEEEYVIKEELVRRKNVEKTNPTEQKHVEQKPVEQKPAEQKPAEQKPSEQKPAEQKPAEQKPVEQKPAEQKPSEQKPVEQKPAEQKPAEQKPSEQKPSEQKPSEQKPVEQKPSEESSEGSSEEISEDSSSEEPSSEESSSEEPSDESSEAPSEEEQPERLQCVEVTLSGNAEDVFVADTVCYAQSEKYVLAMDKGIQLPGDFVNILDDLIDELENITGLVYNPYNYETPDIDIGTIDYGYNIWEDIKLGDRILIHLGVDTENVGYISNAASEFATIYAYELYSDETVKNIEEASGEKLYIGDSIDYFVFAHELTHVLSGRYTTLSEIMTEGSADYYGLQTLKSLSQTHEAVIYDSIFDSYYELPEEITADTAEKIFWEDYSSLSVVERGPQYMYGKVLCTYLNEIYGEEFFSDLLEYVYAQGHHCFYGYFTDEDKDFYVDCIKTLFGETVFNDFGNWYQENKENFRPESWGEIEEPENPTIPTLVTLSGEKGKDLVTTEKCYLESDKYILLMDAGLQIPGDFREILDDLVDQTETETGLVYNPENFVLNPKAQESWYRYALDWKYIEYNNKLVIYLANDYSPYSYWFGNKEVCEFNMSSLYTEETWKEAISKEEVDYEKGTDLLYDILAKGIETEMAARYGILNRTLSWGAADYYAQKVLKALERTYEEFGGFISDYSEFWVPKEITVDNAETDFRNDYLDELTQYYQEIYGRLFYEFLEEAGYEGYYKKLLLTCEKEIAVKDDYSLTEEEKNKYADVVKDLFGDTVFEEFAKWYQGPKGEVTLPTEITLSGNAGDYFVAEEKCYLSSDKYILLIEEHIKLPGNFAQIMDALVDEMEAQTGLVYNPNGYVIDVKDPDFELSNSPDWKYIDYGDKLIIKLCCDEEDVGYIPYATKNCATIFTDELYSDEIWEQIVASSGGERVRQDGIDYSIFVHELMHCFTDRHATVNSIMNEGGAEYYGLQVTKKLADLYEDVVVYPRADQWISLPEEITAENAERIFTEDYKDIPYENRGAEYTLGKCIHMYLARNFEQGYYKRYLDLVGEKMECENYYYFTDEDRSLLAELFKEAYGEDIFTQFGTWYQENIAEINPDISWRPEYPEIPAESVLIELSGNSDDVVITTEKSFLEEEKYIITFDAGLQIPGNFTRLLNAIVNQVEEDTGLSCNPEGQNKLTIWVENTWEPCLASRGYNKDGIEVAFDALYTDEVWQEIIKTSGEESVKSSAVDYSYIYEVLVKSVTIRHSAVNQILLEGGCEFLKTQGMTKLAAAYADITYTPEEVLFGGLPEKVTAETAETIFRNDYKDNRYMGYEYTFGKAFCSFLYENYGADFYSRIIHSCKEQISAENWYEVSDEDREKIAEICRELFGETVFTDFGSWYQQNEEQ